MHDDASPVREYLQRLALHRRQAFWDAAGRDLIDRTMTVLIVLVVSFLNGPIPWVGLAWAAASMFGAGIACYFASQHYQRRLGAPEKGASDGS